MSRVILTVLAALLLVAGGALYLDRTGLAVMAARYAAQRAMSKDTLERLGDSLSVGFCGTGSPLPDPTRSGPCTAVIAGKRLFIVDSGRGAADVIGRMGFRPGQIEAVLLTHFHSDHIDGLGQLAEQHWVDAGARTPLTVYGAPGVERVVAGFNEAYAQNGAYRTAHHGADVAPPSGYGLAAHVFAIGAPPNSDAIILDDNGLKITAFTVNHGPVRPALGYRFDYRGRSVVISGDTAKSANLVRVATNADLLVHEALSPRLVEMLGTVARAQNRAATAHIMHDIVSYHTAPEDAADEASAAHVRALILTHIIPPLPIAPLEGVFLGDARTRFKGRMFIARDGDIARLPANGGALERRNVLAPF